MDRISYLHAWGEWGKKGDIWMHLLFSWTGFHLDRVRFGFVQGKEVIAQDLGARFCYGTGGTTADTVPGGATLLPVYTQGLIRGEMNKPFTSNSGNCPPR